MTLWPLGVRGGSSTRGKRHEGRGRPRIHPRKKVKEEEDEEEEEEEEEEKPPAKQEEGPQSNGSQKEPKAPGRWDDSGGGIRLGYALESLSMNLPLESFSETPSRFLTCGLCCLPACACVCVCVRVCAAGVCAAAAEPPAKRVRVEEAFQLSERQQELIKEDTPNKKVWDEALSFLGEGPV